MADDELASEILALISNGTAERKPSAASLVTLVTPVTPAHPAAVVTSVYSSRSASPSHSPLAPRSSSDSDARAKKELPSSSNDSIRAARNSRAIKHTTRSSSTSANSKTTSSPMNSFENSYSYSSKQENFSKSYADNYDDDLMGSDSDRELLEALPELERERILNERAEKRELMRERDALQRELRKKGLDLDDVNTSATPKNIKKQQLEALKDKREQIQKKRSELNSTPDTKSTDSHRKDTSPLENSPPLDSVRNSSLRASSSHKSNRDATPTPDVILSDLQKMQLTRKHVTKWCFSNFFDNLAIGSFVRLMLGEDNGNRVYRIAEIIDIVYREKPYRIDKTLTNKAFLLRHGHHEKLFFGDIFSNGSFTESEFNRWQTQVKEDGISQPDASLVTRKVKKFADAEQHVFTEEEISEIVARKRKLSVAPINIPTEKAELLRQREVAISERCEEKVGEIDAKLEHLRKMAAASLPVAVKTHMPILHIAPKRPRGVEFNTSVFRKKNRVSINVHSSVASDPELLSKLQPLKNIPRPVDNNDEKKREKKTFEELFLSAAASMDVDI